MKKKYTEHSLIEKYQNLTSLIKYYETKLSGLNSSKGIDMLPVYSLEKVIKSITSTEIYDQSYYCRKLSTLEEELKELVSRKDFGYVNSIIEQEKTVLVEATGSSYDTSYSDSCIMM